MFHLLLINQVKDVNRFRIIVKPTNTLAKVQYFFSSSNNSKFRTFKICPKTYFCYHKFASCARLCVILYEKRRFLCHGGMYLYNNRAKKKRAGNRSDSFLK